MKFFTKRKDGGPKSNVTGYWLIEWKSAFSIALLRFSEGSREAYHSHAFNSISWVLWGSIFELMIGGATKVYRPNFKPVITRRNDTHKVFGLARATWVLTFRGPWSKNWQEVLPNGEIVNLTHGRKVVTTV